MKTKNQLKMYGIATLVAILCYLQLLASPHPARYSQAPIQDEKIVVGTQEGNDSYKLVLSNEMMLKIVSKGAKTIKIWNPKDEGTLKLTTSKLEKANLKEKEDVWSLILGATGKSGQEYTSVTYLKKEGKNLVSNSLLKEYPKK